MARHYKGKAHGHRGAGYRSITAKVGNGDGFTVRVMQATSLPTLYLTSSSAAENRTYIDASKTNTTTTALRMLDAAGDEIGVGNIRSTAVVLFSFLESMWAIFGLLSTCLCKLAFSTNSTIYFCIFTQRL